MDLRSAFDYVNRQKHNIYAAWTIFSESTHSIEALNSLNSNGIVKVNFNRKIIFQLSAK